MSGLHVPSAEKVSFLWHLRLDSSAKVTRGRVLRLFVSTISNARRGSAVGTEGKYNSAPAPQIHTKELTEELLAAQGNLGLAILDFLLVFIRLLSPWAVAIATRF